MEQIERKESKFERKEEMPFEADLRVDFIRHGKPVYTQEELKTGQPEGTLTPEDRKELKIQMKKLASGIDKEKELVVIWSSPRRRSRQTAEVVREVFEEEGISILEKQKSGEKLRIKKSLRDVDMTAEAAQQVLEGKIPSGMASWLEGKFPKGVETPEEFRERFMRIITYLERIARTVHLPEGKKLHFICAVHGETIGDLLETAYGIDVRKDSAPTFGEVTRVDIHKSEPGKDAVLDLSYEGYPKAKLGFDKEKRKLYKLKNEGKCHRNDAATYGSGNKFS